MLVLLLGGLTTPASPGGSASPRAPPVTHCRAVLRKLGAGDRRVLRARLLAGASGAAALLFSTVVAGPPRRAAVDALRRRPGG